MERLDYGSPEKDPVEKTTRSRKSSAKKRKWREIEALKEQAALRKTLEELDVCQSSDERLD